MPATDLMQRKLARMFALYDRDGDGLIEQADYERVADGFARTTGTPAGTEKYETLRTTYLGFWAQLAQAADHDHDGRVTLDEYASTYSRIGAMGPAIIAIADTIIRLTDRDGDGKISREEFSANLQAYDVSAADAGAAFGHLDRDGDGYLVREELLEDVEEFYTSDDPAAPGNWLVGPL
jgi:Ca2+-binding EF-hand superfamily protein